MPGFEGHVIINTRSRLNVRSQINAGVFSNYTELSRVPATGPYTSYIILPPTLSADRQLLVFLANQVDVNAEN